jgi:hypothetical protein
MGSSYHAARPPELPNYFYLFCAQLPCFLSPSVALDTSHLPSVAATAAAGAPGALNPSVAGLCPARPPQARPPAPTAPPAAGPGGTPPGRSRQPPPCCAARESPPPTCAPNSSKFWRFQGAAPLEVGCMFLLGAAPGSTFTASPGPCTQNGSWGAPGGLERAMAFFLLCMHACMHASPW